MSFIIREPFKNLFPKQERVVNGIRENMAEKGFDRKFPIILGTGPWTADPVLIDGHTRLMIADELGIAHVPEVTENFTTELEALEYAILVQSNRRSITDSELAGALNVYDRLKQRGGDNNLLGNNQYRKDERSKAQLCAIDHTDETVPKTDQEEPNFVEDMVVETLNIKPETLSEPKGKSAETMAKLFGVSTRKVEQARTVMNPDTPSEIKEAVLSGEKSINKAYNEVREIKKQEEQFKKVEVSQKDDKPSVPVFNRTNDNIKWAKWTWNPVSGCKHDCYYCYARELANRFNNGDFEPKFIPGRLSAPFNTKIPSSQIDIPGIHNVFVCSMSDLFGEWVEQGWIDKVLDACRKTPQWTYIFLTKNPKRLTTIKFPENSWVGTTIDIKARVKPALEYMPQVMAPVKFISAEPLLEDLEVDEVPGIDWVIIGARSKTASAPEFQPEPAWVERLHMAARRSGCKVYWKTNLIFKHPEEYPAIRRHNND